MTKRNVTKERWKEQGLCTTCGGQRAAHSKAKCQPCLERAAQLRREKHQAQSPQDKARRLEKHNQRQQRIRDQRAAKNRCLVCNQSLCTEKPGPDGIKYKWCAKCRNRGRRYILASKRRKRGFHEPVPEFLKPWSMARAIAPLNGNAGVFRVKLDGAAQKALQTLLARYREQEARAGNTVRTHALSATVRRAIMQWEGLRVSPPPVGWSCSRETPGFVLDAKTRAIVEWQAQSPWFNGNRSAAIRAILWYCAFPKLIGKTGGQKR